MRFDYKQFQVMTILIVMSCLTIGSLSVTGLLQSTETVGSSGIVVRAPPPAPAPLGGGSSSPPSPPPPEPQVEIDIYNDLECTQIMSDISWGEIEAGETSTATIYVKNSGETGVTLSLDSENWSPSNAEDYMDLDWDYDNTNLQIGEVRGITLTLDVDADCPAMSGFVFDVVIIGS